MVKFENIQALLIDLEGVLYSDNKLIDGSSNVLKHLRQKELNLRFLTNTTTIPRNKILEKLINYGFDIKEEEIFTPITATKKYLEENGFKEIFLVTNKELITEFENYELTDEKPKAVIMGDIYKDFNWDILNKIFKLIHKQDAQIISLHQNKYCVRNNEISLDLGPFVKAIEYASNKNAVLMGKPNKNFFDLVIKDLNSHHENILMIGDDIRSDIEGGNHAGLKTIQVKTGKYQSSDDQNSLQPDARIENINEVLNLL